MEIGKSVWYANRINTDGEATPKFKSAVEIKTRANYFTVMPATSGGYLAMRRYGAELENTWIAVANKKYFELHNEFILGKSILGTGKVYSSRINMGDFVIKVGDLMWVDGESPISNVENEYGNGASATAIVDSLSVQNNYINITLKRNKEQVRD